MTILISLTILAHIANLICSVIRINPKFKLYDVISIAVSVLGIILSALLFIPSMPIFAFSFSLSCFIYAIMAFFNFKRWVLNDKKHDVITYIIYGFSAVGVIAFLILGLL